MTDHADLPHVIVCGGRDFTDMAFIAAKLDTLTAELGRIVVCTGACPTGVDCLAEVWAHQHHHVVKRYHPDWKEHGLKAGPIRNREMATEVATVRDRWCIAFPGGRGTASCIEECRKAGIPVREVGRGKREGKEKA